MSSSRPQFMCALLLVAAGCGDDPMAPVVDRAPTWTLAVLPDTQYYASNFPDIFDAQTRWLADNEADLNIKYAVHEGDVVDLDEARQWQNASRSLHFLDGKIPYSVLPGNHDYQGDGGVSSRSSMINRYFPLSGFLSWNSSLKESYQQDSIENTAHVFDAGGQSYIVVSLEFGPRDPVVDWARDVLARNAGAIGIVVTHAYLYRDGSRYDWQAKGSAQFWNPHSYLDKLGEHVNDGQELWDKLITGAPNVRLVLSGHAKGVARHAGDREGGTPVFELMSDYQDEGDGGDGWLRLMEFGPGSDIIVRTYSPHLGKYRTDSDNFFRLQL